MTEFAAGENSEITNEQVNPNSVEVDAKKTLFSTFLKNILFSIVLYSVFLIISPTVGFIYSGVSAGVVLVYYYLTMLLINSHIRISKILAAIWITITTISLLTLLAILTYIITKNSNGFNLKELFITNLFLLAVESRKGGLLIGSFVLSAALSPLFVFNYTFLKILRVDQLSINRELNKQTPSLVLDSKFSLFRIFFFVLSVIIGFPSFIALLGRLRGAAVGLPEWEAVGFILALLFFIINLKLKNNTSQAKFLIKLYLILFYVLHIILIPINIFSSEFIFTILGSLVISAPINFIIFSCYKKINTQP